MLRLVRMGTLSLSTREATLQENVFTKREVRTGTERGRGSSGTKRQLSWHRCQSNLAGRRSCNMVSQTVPISESFAACFAEM